MEGYTPEELAAAGLSPDEMAAMAGEAPVEEAVVEAQPEVPVAPVEGEDPGLPVEAAPVEPEPVEVAQPPRAMQSDPFTAKMVGPQMTPEVYKAALADLRNKAETGEIDSLDYADAVADLKAQVAVSHFAQQNNAATETQKWAYAQEAFKAVHPEYASPVMWGALDAMVRQLAGDPEVQKLSDIAFLSLAHEKAQEALGLSKPAPAAPAAPTPDRAPAMERMAGKIPPSLGGLPAAQSSQPENEFAGLDKLEGMEQEAEIAKMQRSDPTKYERWLRAGA